MKIQNAFRLGLLGGLGVLLAVMIGDAVHSLQTIITYVGAALFLALGIDPAVSLLQRRKVPRPAAILIVLVLLLGILAGLVLALIPVIADQVGKLIAQIPTIVAFFQNQSALQEWWDRTLPWLPFDKVLQNLQDFLTGNLASITGGVWNTAIGIASGTFGVLIVAILTIYFVASLASIKRGLYQLVPASQRETFIGLAEQVSHDVGRYVGGQVVMGLCNGVLTFAFLNILGLVIGEQIQYWALLAFIAFLCSLVPLVGTLTGSVIITLAVWLFNGFPAVLIVAIWYLIYMQVESYVISPRVMNRAVKVPGVVVVLAALIGGTLLGLLGALIAIPVAAAILLIIKQVVVPRQNAL